MGKIVIPKLLDSLEIGWLAWFDKDPRGQVKRYQKTSLREFKVTLIYKKNMLIKFQIERVK